MITAAPIPGGFFAAGPASSDPPTPPPPTPTQLAAPSLAAGVPTDALTTRSVPLTVAGPASWPAGVLVQLQTRRVPGAWANAGTPVAGGTMFVLPREAAPYELEVRGVATNGGALGDSDVSAALVLPVPEAPTVPALNDATPLACAIALAPGSPTPARATADGVRPLLIARDDSDAALVISDVTRVLEGDPHTPQSIAFALEDEVGVLLEETLTGPGPVWRTGIHRDAFAPRAGALTLRLTFTAQDDSITTIECTVRPTRRG